MRAAGVVRNIAGTLAGDPRDIAALTRDEINALPVEGMAEAHAAEMSLIRFDLGERSDEDTTESLSASLDKFCHARSLPFLSADDILAKEDEELTTGEREWLSAFIVRSEALEMADTWSLGHEMASERRQLDGGF